MLRFLQRIHDVLCGLFGHSIQCGERRQAQSVQIRQGFDDVGVDQLVYQLVTQAFDFNGPALGEMQDRLLALRAAEQAASAPVICLIFFAHRRAAAHRAHARHGENGRLAHAFLQHHRDDFRDHVTRAAHDHGIAHPHVFAAGFVFVVQRGVGYRGAADKHGRQLDDRRQLASATDLHVNRQHRGGLLLRRVFVRHRPTRLACDKPKLALHRKAIDFVDDPVNVEPQRIPLTANTLVIRYQFSSSLRMFYET